MLVVASQTLLSNDSCVIPFLFLDLTCFKAETVLKTSSGFFAQNLSVWEILSLLTNFQNLPTI